MTRKYFTPRYRYLNACSQFLMEGERPFVVMRPFELALANDSKAALASAKYEQAQNLAVFKTFLIYTGYYWVS